MKLFSRSLMVLAIALCAVPFAITTARSAEQSPDEVLSAKGLTKVGTQYLLELDAKLQDKLRVVRQAQKQIETNKKKRSSIEIEIAHVNDVAKQLAAEYRSINAQFTGYLTPQKNNQLVARAKTIETDLKEADKVISDRQKELATIVDPNDDFVTNAMDLAGKMEEASKQYDVLAEDPAVTAALATLNLKAPPKVRLGPSSQFASELKPMLKLRDSMSSAVIKCDMSSGLAEVPVSINGKASEKMIVDSGASAISIGAAFAERAGIKATDSDPEVDISIANGAHVKGHMLIAKTVRVGQFTVENVRCIVLPAPAKNAPNLLGGTFLRNFVYRMDLTAGELHLAQMSGKPAKGETLASAATTKPAETRNATTTPAPKPPVLDIRAVIDGDDIIRVTAAGLVWTHKSDNWPTGVQVNGIPWNPQSKAAFINPTRLPQLTSANWQDAKIVGQSGRGTLTMEAADDGLVIHMSDPAGGSDKYQIRISIPSK